MALAGGFGTLATRNMSRRQPSSSLSLQYKAFSFRLSQLDRSPTMAQTVRYYWGEEGPGEVGFNLNWASINWDSVVIITATQYVAQDPPTDDYRINGPPYITVQNIAPHGPPFDPNHGVSFTLLLSAKSLVVTDITLLPPPIYVGYPPTTTPLSSSTTATIQIAPGQKYLVQGQLDDRKEAPEEEGQEREREKGNGSEVAE